PAPGSVCGVSASTRARPAAEPAWLRTSARIASNSSVRKVLLFMPPGVPAGNRLPLTLRHHATPPKGRVSLRRSAISRGSRGRESCPPPRLGTPSPTKRTQRPEQDCLQDENHQHFCQVFSGFFRQ